MASVRTQTWKTLLVVALILLVVYLIFSGFVIWYIGLVIVLLAMAGGALMNRTLGPPDH